MLDRRTLGLALTLLAGTYTIASCLPSVLLDNLLVLPHLLVDFRNRLLPPPTLRTDPASNHTVRNMPPASFAESAAGTGTTLLALQRSTEQVSAASRTAVTPELHPAVDEQEMNSDADVESNDGDVESTGVGSSWVSLGLRESSE